MNITITYKPLTVYVPDWAAADVKRLSKSKKRRDKALLVELLDDIAEHEGWAPEADVVTCKG